MSLPLVWLLGEGVPAQTKLVSEPEEIGNVIEEVGDLARQINFEVDSDDIQELQDSRNPELTMDELVETHEQEQEMRNFSLKTHFKHRKIER
ncbi:hypothetical protein TNCV_773421 [Trichonephila clavipes]|nr:hypothetical protein TNCV_773421 [Trichonephila clavipes]